MIDVMKSIRIIVMIAIYFSFSINAMRIPLHTKPNSSAPNFSVPSLSVFSKLNLSSDKLAPMAVDFMKKTAVKVTENFKDNPKSSAFLVLLCLIATGYRYLPMPDMSNVKQYCKATCCWAANSCLQLFPENVRKKLEAINLLIILPLVDCIIKPLIGWPMNPDNYKYIVMMTLCGLAGHASRWPSVGYAGAGGLLMYSLLFGKMDRVENEVKDARDDIKRLGEEVEKNVENLRQEVMQGFSDATKTMEALEIKLIQEGKINHEALKEEIKSIDNHTQQSILGVANQINGLENQLQIINKSNSSLSQQITDSTIKVSDVNTKVEEINTKVSDALDTVDRVSEQVKNVHGVLNQLEKDEKDQAIILQVFNKHLTNLDSKVEEEFKKLGNEIHIVHIVFSERLKSLEKGQQRLEEQFIGLDEKQRKHADRVDEQLSDMKQKQIENYKKADQRLEEVAGGMQTLSQKVDASSAGQNDNAKLLQAAIGTMQDQSKQLEEQNKMLEQARQREKERDNEIAMLKAAIERIEKGQASVQKSQEEIKELVSSGIQRSQTLEIDFANTVDKAAQQLGQRIDDVNKIQQKQHQQFSAAYQSLSAQIQDQGQQVLNKIDFTTGAATHLSVPVGNLPQSSGGYSKAPNFEKTSQRRETVIRFLMDTSQ